MILGKPSHIAAAKDKKREKVLLIDEVDVFFSD